MARVAVISDTHLPRRAHRLPEGCLERLRAADLILHAGDVVSVSALEELLALGPPVEAVHGNMDEPALKETLPKERVVELGGASIGMVHIPGPAAGRDARLAARFPACNAVVYGHTHVPRVERVQHLWLLNPGSPTDRRRQPAHTMLLLEVDEGAIVPELIELPS
ncbi:MAG: metallophosphoesterase family protein [Gaiellaceae bacterium]